MVKKMGHKISSLSTHVTRAAFSSIFKKPATQKYPFVKASIAEQFRGKQVFDTDKCLGCGLCSKDCPANAIDMVAIEGKKRPLFHLDRCIFCYQCSDSCPKNAIQPTKIFELASIDKATLAMAPQAPKPIPAPTAVQQPVAPAP